MGLGGVLHFRHVSFLKSVFAECRGAWVNTCLPYAGSTGFESWPRDQLLVLRL